jgi:hypothetical protein
MRFGPFALALALSAWAGHSAAQNVVLDPDEMRFLAQQALSTSNPEIALNLTSALLARDPGDVQALILRSQALRDLDRIGEAARDAKAAWNGASTDQLRFGAAMVMAQALSSGEKRTAAQLWLRRAAEAAPDDAARELAERDFSYVRSRNPWVLQFTFSVTPSSNLNNGSTSDVFDFYGFPLEITGDGKALSGFETALGLTAIYRLVPTEYALSKLRFSVFAMEPTLSSEAQEQAPEARGSDYAYSNIELGYETEIKAPGSDVTYDLAASIGHNWYGGSDLSDTFRLSFGLQKPLGASTLGFIEINGERQSRIDDAENSADILGISAGFSHILANNDQVNLTVSRSETNSANDETAHDTWKARLGWNPSRTVGGVTVSGGVSFEASDYDLSRYSPDGRHDEKLSIDVSVGLPNIEYYGFSPRIDLNAGQTKSNVGLFDTREMGLRIGIDSTF